MFSAIKVQVICRYGHACISQRTGAMLGANLSSSMGTSTPQVIQKLPPSRNLSNAKHVLTTVTLSISQHLLQGCFQKTSARRSCPVAPPLPKRHWLWQLPVSPHHTTVGSCSSVTNARQSGVVLKGSTTSLWTSNFLVRW